MQGLEIDACLFGCDHQKYRILLVFQEQVLGVPAGNRAAQRLALLDGEQRRMRRGLVRDSEAVEEGEQIIGRRRHGPGNSRSNFG